jgi:hypothetical protein
MEVGARRLFYAAKLLREDSSEGISWSNAARLGKRCLHHVRTPKILVCADRQRPPAFTMEEESTALLSSDIKKLQKQQTSRCSNIVATAVATSSYGTEEAAARARITSAASSEDDDEYSYRRPNKMHHPHHYPHHHQASAGGNDDDGSLSTMHNPMSTTGTDHQQQEFTVFGRYTLQIPSTRRLAISLSLYFNIAITAAKLVAYIRTLSLSVLAALLDSVLDVVSQV